LKKFRQQHHLVHRFLLWQPLAMAASRIVEHSTQPMLHCSRLELAEAHDNALLFLHNYILYVVISLGSVDSFLK